MYVKLLPRMFTSIDPLRFAVPNYKILTDGYVMVDRQKEDGYKIHQVEN